MTSLLAVSPTITGPRELCYADFQVASAYQPIVSLTHQRVVGVEALARPKKDAKSISPGALFHKASTLNQNAMLDIQLWEQHLHNFARGAPPTWLFLNVSADSIGDPSMAPDLLAERVKASGLRCDQIVLEIVEEAVASESALIDFVEQAKAQGFRVAVDDFGADDANFERVWRLKPFIVKMDRAMIVHAAANATARKLFISLVRLIRESGSLVLVEGVETRQEADIAMESEADLYQGFYFARPAAALNGFYATEQQLQRSQRDYDQTRFMELQQHQDLLKHLRFEILAACHQLAREDLLENLSGPLLDIPGVARCFLLDTHGTQQGQAVADRHQQLQKSFNPLYQSQGASWSHREYFRQAMANPSCIHISRPYVALPDTLRTVTLSVKTYTRRGNRVFCIDIHPDEAFPGCQELPAAL
ncbi:MAG: EAL domain-containing protein [Halomonadaceae bacterium]|nr:MAG: EAL domain-containing protein [Halomonadaceae bacterium]